MKYPLNFICVWEITSEMNQAPQMLLLQYSANARWLNNHQDFFICIPANCIHQYFMNTAIETPHPPTKEVSST